MMVHHSTVEIQSVAILQSECVTLKTRLLLVISTDSGRCEAIASCQLCAIIHRDVRAMLSSYVNECKDHTALHQCIVRPCPVQCNLYIGERLRVRRVHFTCLKHLQSLRYSFKRCYSYIECTILCLTNVYCTLVGIALYERRHRLVPLSGRELQWMQLLICIVSCRVFMLYLPGGSLQPCCTESNTWSNYPYNNTK